MMSLATAEPWVWKLVAVAIVIAALCSVCLVAWLVWPAPRKKPDRHDP